MSKTKHQKLHKPQLCPGEMEWSEHLTDRYGRTTYGWRCLACNKTFTAGSKYHSLEHVAQKGE